MFSFTHQGSFRNTERFLEAMIREDIYRNLNHYGQIGVTALASVTPVDTRITSTSWSYKIEETVDGPTIFWTNDSMAGGTPVVILLQYGHGTGTGGYVEGRDYINPAIQPVFDQILKDVWKAVTSA